MHKTALKLDDKMITYLRNVPSMKKTYEDLRKLQPRLIAPEKGSSDAEKSSPKKPGVASATLFDETVEATLKSVAKRAAESSSSAAKSLDDDLNGSDSDPKMLTTRTLDKDEIQKLCLNLFAEIKADENLVCLKYLTKVNYREMLSNLFLLHVCCNRVLNIP